MAQVEKVRCAFPGTDPLYVKYHDEEWGAPEFNSAALFELLALESFQAGLSWITILRKRQSFRDAFNNFDASRVARYGAKDVDRLLQCEGIVRSSAKILATIKAAQLWEDIQARNSKGFSNLVWKHVDGKPIQNRWKRHGELPAETEQSQALSKELKQKGFKFCGPVIVYAFMQAAGLVNDHLVDCYRHTECAKIGSRLPKK